MQKEKILVMKFGGASLETPAHFDRVANLVVLRMQEYPKIVIVVSAMGKTTDGLITLAHQVNPTPPQREVDMLLTVGERISMALLAMAFAKRNIGAISFTGSQSGIITCSNHNEARIIDVRPKRILESLEKNKIVIIAGFQGVSRQGEITTLGRGGSDTTAVALGIALKAEKVEFFKDVPGVFSCDPKCTNNASLFEELSYNQAMEIVSKGAKILHLRCLELAKLHAIPLHVLSFKDEHASFGGTKIQNTQIQNNQIQEIQDQNAQVPLNAPGEPLIYEMQLA